MNSKQTENPEIFAPSGALVKLIHEQRGRFSMRQRIEGARMVVARSTGERPSTKRRIWFWALSPIAIGALAMAVFAVERHRAGTLSYAVDGGHVESSGLVQAEPTAQPRLLFSDGSEVLLSRGTKAFVRSIDNHGARVSVTDGKAHVDVAHVQGAHWLFDAGPFLIAVKGTAFTVAWKPADEELDVQMERGTVGVSGPLSDEAIPLRSGQHLTIRVREHETLVRDIGDEAAPAMAAAAAAAPIELPAMLPTTTSGMPPRARGESRGWAAKVAAGEFETVVRQAVQGGLEGSLTDAPSADLAALADAARYSRHGDVATRALLAERRRFPQSTGAHDACFLLGRLEEANQNGAEAIAWYDTYLAESPKGTYASEALGRKMELTYRVQGDETARAVAGEYLNRFPQGMYAARARAIDHSP